MAADIDPFASPSDFELAFVLPVEPVAPVAFACCELRLAVGAVHQVQAIW